MKIIASTGNKGGVGKTTFAILLSFKLLELGKTEMEKHIDTLESLLKAG